MRKRRIKEPSIFDSCHDVHTLAVVKVDTKTGEAEEFILRMGIYSDPPKQKPAQPADKRDLFL